MKILTAVALSLLLASPAFSQADPHSTGEGKKTGHSKHHAKRAQMDRADADLARLQTILFTLNRPMEFTPAAWRSSANEALMLSNRLYARVRTATTSGDARQLAKDIRTHVRMMHKEVVANDASGAREHIRETLPLLYRLDDWTDG